jgi:hypothetical protein
VRVIAAPSLRVYYPVYVVLVAVINHRQ